ncbi:benzoate/H(+) symporter BenE family transporter [Roseibium sp.]|uniref:benzoate/H(+) symporter BenE family transporter n=1 Tax=Roseibium sp. TaxID=1936156 RepID=UPI003A972B13
MATPYPSLQAASAGILAAIVGSASSFAVVVHGLSAVGATPEQAASGLMALCIAQGLAAILASLVTRMPISMAWSTPGAALLATGGAVEGGFPAAVGAFIVCALLIILAGLFRPLGRAVAAIPLPLANAMLAGVLFGLCLAPAKAVGTFPLEALTIIAVWAVAFRFKRLFAVPIAVATTAILIYLTSDPAQFQGIAGLTKPVFVMPDFTPGAAIGIGLPLFIVTMASQNIPGMAVLAVNDYRPDGGRLFSLTGFFSLLAAPFGGHAVNLAAITAAMCANEDAEPDRTRRYWASTICGAFYLVFGLLAGTATAFISIAPPVLIEAVAGLALIGALSGAIIGATKDADTREAAVITFLVTASGLSFFGISGAFWGLIAGGGFMALQSWRGKPA